MSEPRNTRERIQQIAIELFNEQGYDRTSLREIAEELGVTKAALYYHFKTKEDIAASYFDDFLGQVEKLQLWAEEQPNTMPTRHEILRRYASILHSHAQTLKFMHQNMPALRHLDRGDCFKSRMRQLQRLLMPSEPDAKQRLRAIDAIMTMHMAWFLEVEDHTPEQLSEPALEIARELVTTNGE